MLRGMPMRRRPGATGSDERGSAVVEFVWVGILLLVPVVWIVLTVFTAQRGAFAVSTAARAAGRAFALAPDDASGRAAARAAASRALVDQGIDGGEIGVDVSCTPYPGSCHSGTSVITVRVDSRVDLPLLPDALGGGKPSLALDATHTVPIGQHVVVDAGG